MPRYRNDEIIEALKEARGIVSVAARALGCSRWVIDQRIRKVKKVREVFEDERAAIIEVAEDALCNIVENPNHPNHFNAVRFTLRTLGKNSGYTFRDEVEHTIPTPDKVVFVPIEKPAVNE